MKEENNLQGKTSRLLYFMSELEKGHKVNKTDYLNVLISPSEPLKMI